MWVTFTVLKACSLFGGIAIAVIVTGWPQGIGEQYMKDLEHEYKRLTGVSRWNG